MLRCPRRRTLATLAAGSLAALSLSACATIDQDDLSGYVDQLHSDAAEGALVAGQAARGRVPYIFVWLQSAELAHQVQELHDKFDGEISGNLGAQVDRARNLAIDIGDELGDLHDSAKSRAVATDVETKLKGHARQAESLYEELE